MIATALLALLLLAKQCVGQNTVAKKSSPPVFFLQVIARCLAAAAERCLLRLCTPHSSPLKLTLKKIITMMPVKFD